MESSAWQVDLSGDWRAYAPRLPRGCDAFGVITLGVPPAAARPTGALLSDRKTGVWLMFRAGVLTPLDERLTWRAVGADARRKWLAARRREQRVPGRGSKGEGR